MERENSTNFISEDDLQPYKTCFDESPAAFCVIDVLKDRKEIRYSTLEVAGTPELLRASADYITNLWNS